MSRKIIALFLMLALFLSLVSGCSKNVGSEQSTTAATSAAVSAEATSVATSDVAGTTAEVKDDLEFVTLDWYLVMSPPTMPDTEMVWDTVNEYFKEKINCEVNIHLSNYDDLKTKASTMIAAGQQFDICYTGQGVPYLENATRNAFVALDDLLPQYAPQTLEQIPDYAWDAMRVNGTIYSIPVYKDLAKRLNFIYNETMVNELKLDIGSVKYTTNMDLLDFLYTAKEARDAAHSDMTEYPIIKSGLDPFENFYYIDNVLSCVYVNIPELNMISGYDDKTVFNMYELQEYRDHCNRIKQLVDDNILPYDINNYDKDNALRDQGVYIGDIGQGSISIQKNFRSDNWDSAMIVSDIAYTYPTKIKNNGQAISTTSPNPERALMMLELVNNDTYVATTLRFGLEGVHHTTLPNGQITVDDTPNNGDAENRGYYYWYGFQIGSIFVMQVPSFEPENFFELMDKMNKTAYAAGTMGFNLDTTALTTEIATLSSVTTEYKDLASGMIDNVDEMLDECIEALKAAGIEKVMTESQNQLTAFYAAQ